MNNIEFNTSFLKQSPTSFHNRDFQYFLKKVPEDFLVEEVPKFYKPSMKKQIWHFQLCKEGMTTSEAITNISNILGIPENHIGYAGLKDEDGVTSQRISIQSLPNNVDINAINSRLDMASGKWLSLHKIGCFEENIKIGQLVGNSFRVVIRNLHNHIAHTLAKQSSHNHAFINYYDTQRFGVPGGPSTTHLIGQSFHQGEWEKALLLVRESASPEAQAAQKWQGKPVNFFHQLDPRRLSFYYASYGSYQWNHLVAQEFQRDHEGLRVIRSSIPYILPNAYSDIMAFAAAMPWYPFSRIEIIDGKKTEKQSLRPTVVHTYVKIVELTDDHEFPDRSSLTVEFFLPSGCYATMAICQFVYLANAHTTL
ncbi:tRNA pseudouridine(13) synthase TruD [Xenorhabdus bovienii]|uniref:tRNA pseudouridine(13) synthase TruD n=1 Tax=Xenorhabdus bovienii TaxID=40576 RepID=A0AAJ1J8L3_XENBV|nr:tRNA pseudouridine(13) synthase TruD [Xenorhabdus bovienii]MDE1478911.1 tRNA pseudouridine(13) synthase TruD [Xenorhabdus bovienii]MDE1491310.1 tRNA pseudouridine(13) synthase TruD [Xenorhabdus bovienii]MDE9428515.1 tRNA pseudouridine(13) synthase TruD [Xenorhabdus bovienii]MDE9510626.1 tRNA pseudouridine(13) synthase TruD [Xenorhabdus bovienii]MDE9522223.1 tRNA pseudouridine(13) synthase TruD [Xenorhabdus bovienii]